VGSREYLYQVGYEVEPTLDLSSHQVLNGLVVVYNYGSGNCPNSINIPTTTSFQSTPLSTLFPGATEFLNSNMRLSYLNVSPLGANNLYNIDVEVTYGDDGVLLNGTATSTNGTTRCAGTVTNQDFCGTAKLDTVVESRVD
jgi:hypothetical protein